MDSRHSTQRPGAHGDTSSRWRLSHDFRHAHEGGAERRLRWVIAITVVSRERVSADELKARLAQAHEIEHLTVEANRCD